jgi:hypothetical protein
VWSGWIDDHNPNACLISAAHSIEGAVLVSSPMAPDATATRES